MRTINNYLSNINRIHSFREKKDILLTNNSPVRISQSNYEIQLIIMQIISLYVLIYYD